MTQIRRRNYWIDRRTQGPFLLKLVVIWTAGLLILSLLLYHLSDEELGRSFYSVHLRIRNSWQILLPAVLVSGGVSFFVTIGLTMLFAVRESHRLGGPVFKFTRLFRQLEAGSFDPEFRFRKGDLLAPLGESYREAIEANRDRIRRMQSLARTAESSLSLLLEPAGAKTRDPSEQRLLDDAAEQLARVRKMLDSYSLGIR